MAWVMLTQGKGQSPLLLNMGTALSVVRTVEGSRVIFPAGEDSYNVDQTQEEIQVLIAEAEGF